MKLRYKSSRLTYKTLFGYSLVIITLLLVAVPVFAHTRPGNLLEFAFRSETGHTPQQARRLTAGVNLSHLEPGQEEWYTYSRDTFAADSGWVSLAMRYESEAIIEAAQVNFQVMSQAENPGAVVGEGARSPVQAANRNLYRFLWTGQLDSDRAYYVRVFNNSPFGLDYSLDARAEQPAVAGAVPASFGEAAPLDARRTAWALTAQAVENMSAEQSADWLQKAQSVGWVVTQGTAESDIPRPAEADPALLWELTAQALEGQPAEEAAQWLVQADLLGWLSIPLNTHKDPNPVDAPPGDGDGGDDPQPPAQPAPPEDIYSPVSIYPNDPLTFNPTDRNSGRLPPYGEHWYALTRDDLDEELFEDLTLTMFFTPRTGFLSDRINFEIFPAAQYHIWQRGDADYMEHLGAGMWVSRDGDPHTGERVWAGSLVDGDRYLVKVKNGTAEVVDYYLFPGDLHNAELGSPTLHRTNAPAGAMTYNPAPVTRSALSVRPGAGPPEAIHLKRGNVKGNLAQGEEIWYQFYCDEPDDETITRRHFTIYLTNTPTDQIRARHADFAIYPAGQLHIWQRGTVDQLEPLGTSAPSPYETENEKSLQVLWDGHFQVDQLYYIKLYNHDIGPLEYELQIKEGALD